MSDSEKIDILIREVCGIKDDMQGMKSDMQGMKSDMQGMKDDMQVMKGDMQGMKEQIGSLGHAVKKLELHIENVTDRNICIIAEGHLDLSRKLTEAVEAGKREEMLGIRMNVLEEEVRKLKEAVAASPA